VGDKPHEGIGISERELFLLIPYPAMELCADPLVVAVLGTLLAGADRLGMAR
jgi:hypothetical protein